MMAEVHRRKNETIEDLIKRFNKKVSKEGIMSDYKRHEYHTGKKNKKGGKK
jgi:ribosomal protein S21